jgi:hypothetical protein
MTGRSWDKLRTVTTVREAAEQQGFTVTESQADDKLTLDITRDTARYEFLARFRLNSSGNWAWDTGYDYRLGTADQVFTIESLTNRFRTEPQS